MCVTPQMLLEKTNSKTTKTSKKKTKKNTETTLPKLFAPLPVNNQWYINREEMFSIQDVEKGDNIHIPTEKIPNFGQILRK